MRSTDVDGVVTRERDTKRNQSLTIIHLQYKYININTYEAIPTDRQIIFELFL